MRNDMVKICYSCKRPSHHKVDKGVSTCRECGFESEICVECGETLMGLERGKCSVCVSSREHIRDIRTN